MDCCKQSADPLLYRGFSLYFYELTAYGSRPTLYYIEDSLYTSMNGLLTAVGRPFYYHSLNIFIDFIIFYYYDIILNLLNN